MKAIKLASKGLFSNYWSKSLEPDSNYGYIIARYIKKIKK